MNIVTPPHPALRTRAEEVPEDAIIRQGKLIINMQQVLRRNPGAVGLAANQVGVLKRVIVWALPGARAHYAINPSFHGTAEMRAGSEGCLSLPGRQGRVLRHHGGNLYYTKISGEPAIQHGSGLLARIWQHEIDHLDGILFTDLLTPKDQP